MRACTATEATAVKPHRFTLTCTLCDARYEVTGPLTREVRQVLVAHHVARHDAETQGWSLAKHLDAYTTAPSAETDNGLAHRAIRRLARPAPALE